MTAARVSIHGGHSKEFGDAADSTLEEIVRAYVDNGFEWVGLTEHIPPVSADFLLPWEAEEGQTPESRMERFTEYFSTARRLQREYRDSIRILVGFETEGCTGYVEHVNRLRNQFQPDYIVGSVHHVRDICIDGRPEWYAQAVAETGGIEALFCEYFDQQYELIEELKPEVVGHFDLIRMHDKDYRQRLEIPRSQEENPEEPREDQGPRVNPRFQPQGPRKGWLRALRVQVHIGDGTGSLASLASREMIRMGSRGSDCISRRGSRF